MRGIRRWPVNSRTKGHWRGNVFIRWCHHVYLCSVDFIIMALYYTCKIGKFEFPIFENPWKNDHKFGNSVYTNDLLDWLDFGHVFPNLVYFITAMGLIFKVHGRNCFKCDVWKSRTPVVIDMFNFHYINGNLFINYVQKIYGVFCLN